VPRVRIVRSELCHSLLADERRQDAVAIAQSTASDGEGVGENARRSTGSSSRTTVSQPSTTARSSQLRQSSSRARSRVACRMSRSSSTSRVPSHNSMTRLAAGFR
jgi:hypothetical protein